MSSKKIKSSRTKKSKAKSFSGSRRKFLGQSSAAVAAALTSPLTSAQVLDQEIVSAKIHPGIGIARVGNSLEYFIGPEVVEPEVTKAGASRDFRGALKRQAARFRIYGYNRAGQVVRELTSQEADIEWQVHVANKKAAWYQFIVAMDIPEAARQKVPRRNADIRGNRSALVIDPKAKNIKGLPNARPVPLDGGQFKNVPVSLGELRTDEMGRLIFLSGLGKSESPSGRPVLSNEPDAFNNADDWYDDISDGPVRAKVFLNGRSLDVESAWVAVAPPNFAPDMVSFRTLYDLMMTTLNPTADRPSFARDILPALRHLSSLQWVNSGFNKEFGRGSKFDFEDPDFIRKLMDPGQSALRQRIYDTFRKVTQADRKKWPMMYGDAYGTFKNTPREMFAVAGRMDSHLKRWSQNDFVADWSGTSSPFRTLEAVPVQDQPHMLDRANLHFCLADAFHPGCELTWIMRVKSIWKSEFRIKEQGLNAEDVDYGDDLNQRVIFQPGGPLNAQGPGDLTKWMAVPWQGDTVGCRSGYEYELDPFLPTFWPARVPNHVLTQEDYAIVMDKTATPEARLKAFMNRDHWPRSLTGDFIEQIYQSIKEIDILGVVEAYPGIEEDPLVSAIIPRRALPGQQPQKRNMIFVETRKGALGDLLGPRSAESSVPRGGRPKRKSPTTPLEKAGWPDQKTLDSFKRARIRK